MFGPAILFDRPTLRGRAAACGGTVVYQLTKPLVARAGDPSWALMLCPGEKVSSIPGAVRLMSSEPFLGVPGPPLRTRVETGRPLGLYVLLAFRVRPGYLVPPANLVGEDGRERASGVLEREESRRPPTYVRTYVATPSPSAPPIPPTHPKNRKTTYLANPRPLRIAPAMVRRSTSPLTTAKPNARAFPGPLTIRKAKQVSYC